MRPVLIVAATYSVAKQVARQLHIANVPGAWAHACTPDRVLGFGHGAPVIVETDTFRHTPGATDILSNLHSSGAQVLRVSLDKLVGVIR